MKLKQIIFPLALSGVFAFTACDEADTNSYMPRFSGFEYEEPVVAGDSLTITAKQSELGRLIYTTTYNWVCICDWDEEVNGEFRSGRDTCAVLKKKINYGVDPSDPQFKFLVPKNASKLSIVFDAEYNYAGNGMTGEDGSNVGSTGGTNGYIRPVSSNLLFGRTRGTLTISYRQIQRQ